MEKWDGRVAVVVDFAGTSLGLAICKDLVNHGLINLAKTLAKENARGKLYPFQCDVSDEAQVNPVFRWISEKYDGIDLLINICNSMTKGLILDDDNTAALRQVMNTNIVGLCLVAREAAKCMTQRLPERKNIGHIIIVSSTVGEKIDLFWHDGSKPINALYPAGKHASKAIVEALRQELLYMEQENVKITAISPGLVESDTIHDEIGKEHTALSASDVSSAILYAISVKEHVQIHELVIKGVGDFL
ncbi:CLUMA_CG006887, isoform A [Clunio marinus]|uniref:CLUMA_CG006887, isoform A n=1 Tax=Clunio marinus TaxID=568069 RepID=A0A1J1I0P7_9DIPT|nr:CLUMA_CG006887, isoform A [Clunio marinus]